jgi:hypothetical protein
VLIILYLLSVWACWSIELHITCYQVLWLLVTVFIAARYFKGIRNYTFVKHVKGTETCIWWHLLTAYHFLGCDSLQCAN